MGFITVSNSHSQVSFSANTANVLSTVYEMTVPEKIMWSIFDGDPFVLKLRDASDDELPAGALVVVSGITPGRTEAFEVFTQEYRAWRVQSIQDQYDTRKNAMCRLKIPRGRRDLFETHKLLIRINSSTVANAGNSLFELPRVRQLPYKDVANA